METILTALGSAAGGAIVTGLFAVLLFKMKRKAEIEDKGEAAQENFCQVQAGKIDEVKNVSSALTVALRAVLYSIIKSECLKYIQRGEITAKDLEDLIYMHGVYHDPELLNGNGFLDELMSQVKALPIVGNY